MSILGNLKPTAGTRKNRKRVGRGPGSGHGKTSCKGAKGQNCRSGGKTRPGFEGGQMPLQRRLPKRGFTNIFRKVFSEVNVKSLDRFENGSVVDPDELVRVGLIKKSERGGVKVLGDGEISLALTVKAHKFSRSAKEKIESAGGKVEVI